MVQLPITVVDDEDDEDDDVEPDLRGGLAALDPDEENWAGLTD
jgi:hypothetical protein